MPDDLKPAIMAFASVPVDIIYMHEEDGYLRVMTAAGLYVLDSSGTITERPEAQP